MEIKQKIIEFLNRNILLDSDVIYKIRSSIHDLDQEKLQGIYDILLDLDNKQTQELQKKLKENPFFFFEVENEVFREMLAKHLEEEKKEKEMIEKWIEKKIYDV